MRTFRAKLTSVAALSFIASLTAGAFFLTGGTGAQAAETSTCHLVEQATQTNDYGNTIAAWNAEGNCSGVTVNLTTITADGQQQVVSTDDLTDGVATFTYGVPAPGTQFQVQATTADNTQPVILTTITS